MFAILILDFVQKIGVCEYFSLTHCDQKSDVRNDCQSHCHETKLPRLLCPVGSHLQQIGSITDEV